MYKYNCISIILLFFLFFSSFSYVWGEGSLKVTLLPGEVVFAEGRWCFKSKDENFSSPWYKSGEIVENLKKKQYQLYFKDVDGCRTPQFVNIIIKDCELFHTDAVYCCKQSCEMEKPLVHASKRTYPNKIKISWFCEDHDIRKFQLYKNDIDDFNSAILIDSSIFYSYVFPTEERREFYFWVKVISEYGETLSDSALGYISDECEFEFDIDPLKELIFHSYYSQANIGVYNITHGTCNWHVDNNVKWINVLSIDKKDNGNGSVSFEILENKSDESRSGVIEVAGINILINQEAKLNYWVDITVIGHGSILINDESTLSKSIIEGTSISLSVINEFINSFSCWSGDISSYKDRINIIVEKDIDIFANFVNYWTVDIKAKGQNVGYGNYISIVSLGTNFQPFIVRQHPCAPDYSTFLTIKKDLNVYCTYIQIAGQSTTYTWLLSINPKGNLTPPFEESSSVISWDPNQFDPEGSYQLIKGDSIEDTIVIENMREVNEYTVTGLNELQNYLLTWTPPPPKSLLPPITLNIQCESENLTGIYQYNSTIGIEKWPVKKMAHPPPLLYSTYMSVLSPESKNFEIDIRELGKRMYEWIFVIDPAGNAIPSGEESSVKFQWDFSDVSYPGIFKLIKLKSNNTEFENDEILVQDMTTVNEYTFTGDHNNQYCKVEWRLPPTISGLIDDSIPVKSKTWTWNADIDCLFRYSIDQNFSSLPPGEFTNLTSTTLNHVDGKWYLHIQAKDENGSISNRTVSTILDNSPPQLSFFFNDDQNSPHKKIWNWKTNEPDCTFRYSIDQHHTWEASGEFHAITTANLNEKYGEWYIHVQAKDVAGNISNVVTKKGYDEPIPENVVVNPKSTGVMIQWPDDTFSDKVISYRIYRSLYSDGPFVEIDPIIINRNFINDIVNYGIFDPFTQADIHQNTSYWYAISAQMPDGNFSRFSTPVKGEIQTTEDSFQLIPVQQELESTPGKGVTFNIYVIATGNFDDSVELRSSYPSKIPEHVSCVFGETTVIPMAIVDLNINFAINADPGTYDIDIYANGGNRSDLLSLRFSIIPQDQQNSFISTHIKQQDVDLGEHLDKQGRISVRMNNKIDIYGSIIPVDENQLINVFIQNEHHHFTETITTNSEGHYELTFKPKDIGHFTVYSQYRNPQNNIVQSNPIQFAVRKSNQSKIQCEAGNQAIELEKIIQIQSQLIPKLNDIPIHFQITKPDHTKQYYDTSTDSNGECQMNIDLSIAGIWEILAWWDGNDVYEGQLSKPLYLYPGVETPRALIVAGHQENDSLWPSFQYLANRFYQILINRRLNDDLIYVMSSGSDVVECCLDEISPTETKIADYLKNLTPEDAAFLVNEKTPLLIYLVDHGGKNRFQLDTDQYLRADFLDRQLDNLQDKTQCEVQIIIDACYSGSFMDDLAPSESQKRIIITSTGPDHPSYSDYDGRESFSSYLFNWLSQGCSLGESFSSAQSAIQSRPYLYQDQIPTVNNILLANETHLGGTFANSNLMPNIIFHTPNQVLSEPSLTITAEVIDIEDSECLVWASILPPNHHKPIFGEFISPQWQLERIGLNPIPDEENIYAGTYDCFYQKGLYVVYLYASDSVGNIDSKEIYLNVTQDHIPQNWGDMDGNMIIDLEDAIIGLQIMSGMSVQIIREENCKYQIGLEEMIYMLQVLADVN